MSQTPDEVRQEIQALFLSGWTTTIAYDNVDFNTNALEEAWVRLTIAFNTGELATLGQEGDRFFRGFGIVTVQVFTLFGSNASENDLLAKLAKDVFKGVQTTGGVWFRNTGISTVGNEGKWFQQNVTTEFIYEETE